MISGSCMLDSLLCQSPEKLVINAEGIAMAQRMLQGMKVHTETLATGFYEGINFKGGDFLKQRITLQLFQKEQHMPGKVIDRDSMRGWKESGSMDTFTRAKIRVQEILISPEWKRSIHMSLISRKKPAWTRYPRTISRRLWYKSGQVHR